MVFNIGQTFKSYKEVEETLKVYEKNTFAKYWKRDARLITASRIKKVIRPELRYYELKYCCIFGGQRFRKQENNLKVIRTFKKEIPCPAFVALRVSQNGKFLEVKSLNNNHNHETSKALFDFLPQQRKLPYENREEAKMLLLLDANKKRVREKLEKDTGLKLTLKDLSNIKQSATNKAPIGLDQCVDILKNKYDCEVSILKDYENNFKGMFMQTSQMKSTYDAYPELLSIDGTYKLVNIGIPLFLIICEDGNCQTEIVAFCLLCNEDEESFRWFLEEFKTRNVNWTNTKCIITDKDLLERRLVKECFPEANTIICIFHSMRTFGRQISVQKMGITGDERSLSLEILQKMVYAKTSEVFDLLHGTLEENAPKVIVDYFNQNWYNIKDEWSMSKNFFNNNFLNTTNNRIESINSKLKSVIKKNSTLEEFVHSFFTIIKAIENERDYKAASQFQKRIITSYANCSDEKKFMDYLTNEACKTVLKQMEFGKKIVLVNVDANGNSFQLKTSEGEITFGSDFCNCNFATGMLLPCRHIFALRKKLGLPLFCADLIHQRWTLEYYKKKQRLFTSLENDISMDNMTNIGQDVHVTSACYRKPQTFAQKRKNALVLTDSIANLVGQSCGSLFEQRIDVLKTLDLLWKQGKRVKLEILNQYEMEEVEATSSALMESSGSMDTQESEDEYLNINNMEICFADDLNKDNECIQQITLPSSVPEVTFLKANNNITIKENADSLKNIKLPAVVKRRGRPKGSELTAIGIPKQKRNILFKKLHFQERQKLMLSWLVDLDISQVFSGGNLVEEKHVKTVLDIPNSVFNEDVDIHLIRPFFQEEAWKLLMERIELKHDHPITCTVCHHQIINDIKTITCSLCLLPRHMKCASLCKIPKMWYCSDCKVINKK